MENALAQKKKEEKKLLTLFIGIPSTIAFLTFVTIILTWISETQTISTESTLRKVYGLPPAIQHARANNYVAEISVDVTVMKVTISSKTSPGSSNLYMDLVDTKNKDHNFRVRLYHKGGKLYTGTLPIAVDYRRWIVSIYPDNENPRWMIKSEAMFPNSLTTISAN